MKKKPRGKGKPFASGNPGKPKGTKNNKTLVLEAFAKTIVEGGMEKFQRELMKLKGRTFVLSFLEIFEYVRPKLSRTELTGKDGEQLLPTQFVVKDQQTVDLLNKLP